MLIDIGDDYLDERYDEDDDYMESKISFYMDSENRYVSPIYFCDQIDKFLKKEFLVVSVEVIEALNKLTELVLTLDEGAGSTKKIKDKNHRRYEEIWSSVISAMQEDLGIPLLTEPSILRKIFSIR